MKDRVSIKRFLAFLLCAAMLVMYMPSPRLAFADVASGDGAPVAEEPAQTTEPEPAPAQVTAEEPAADPAPAPADAEPSGGSDGGEDLDAEVPSEGEEKPSGEVSGDVEGEEAEEQGDALDGEAVDGEIVDGEETEDPEEEEYPAFKESKTVDGVTITLEAEEGVLPKGASFKAHRVNRDDVFAAVDERLEAEGKELVDAVAFDVTPVDKDGKEIHQPRGSVKVTFSGTGLDVGAGGSVDVFRVSDDANSVTAMGTNVANANTQQFNTNHFTIYVAGGSASNPNGNNSGANKPENRYVLLTYGQRTDLYTTVRARHHNWSISFDDDNDRAFINRDGTTIINNNTSDHDVTATVIHQYRDWVWDDWDKEEFYVTAKPHVITVKFMLREPGHSEYTPLDTVEKYHSQATVIPQCDETQQVGDTTYTFYGWYKDEACQTKVEDSTIVNTIEDMTVYAKYTTNAKLHYDKNCGSAAANVPDDQTGGIGTSVKLQGASRKGYTLRAWTTEPTGGTSYKPEDSVKLDGDMTLYAQWDEDNITIYYSENRPFGDDSWRTQTEKKYSHTNIISDSPRSWGIGVTYIFRGWAIDDDADEPDYYPGDSIDLGNEDITLYALWGLLSINNLEQLEGKNATFEYDGQPHSVSGVTGGQGVWPDGTGNYVKVGDGILSGADVYAKVDGITATGTNAGHYSTPITAPLYYELNNRLIRILDGYPYVRIKPGTLTITPCKVSVYTESKDKKYDGTELVADGHVEFKNGEAPFTHDIGTVTLVDGKTLNIWTTGTQTEVGQSENTFEIDWGKPYGGTATSTADDFNYSVEPGEDGIGTLTVYYLVNFDANAGSDTVTNMPESVKASPKVKLPSTAPTRENYTFLGWAKSADATAPDYQKGEEITVTSGMVVNGEMTLYAIWDDPVMYTVKFVDEDGTTEFSSEDYPAGTSADEIAQPTVPNKTRDDGTEVEFDKWDPELAQVTEDATYTATYKEVSKYTVTYHTNYASDYDSTKEYKVKVGSSHEIKNFNNVFGDKPDHFIFEGWATSSTGRVEYEADFWGKYGEVTTDTDLYAVWSFEGVEEAKAKILYKVKAYEGEESPRGKVDPTAEALWADWYPLIPWLDNLRYHGPENDATATAAEGYEFEGWYVVDPTTGAENKISSNELLTKAEIRENLNKGTISTRFWILVWITITKDVYKDTTFVANFVPITYDVTYSVSGDVPTDYTGTTGREDVTAGEEVTVADVPTTSDTSKDGVPGTWTFNGWTAPSGVTVTDGKFEMPADDVEFTGTWTFTATTYTVTWYDEDGTTELEKDENVAYNADPSYDGDPNPPTKAEDASNTYEFDKWTPDLVPVTANAEYVASYTAYPIYTVTFYANAGDEDVTVPDAIKSKHSKVADDDYKVAIPDTKPTREHYSFLGWAPEEGATEADPSYAPGTAITVNEENVDLYAIWTPVEYTITYDLAGGSVSSDNPTKYTIESDDITLNNPTREGYDFAGWTGTDLTEATKDVKIAKGSHGNRSYTATWTPIPAPTPTPAPTPAGTTDDDDNDGGNGGRAATAAAAAAPAAPADDIVDEPTPTTEPPATTIDDEPTPTTLTWAVANLIMAIVTALGAVIALFRKKDDEDDEDDSADKKMLAAKIAGALAGVAAPITFFLTENMADVAVAFDKWTPLMAGILAVQVVSAVLNKTASKAADAAEEAAE